MDVLPYLVSDVIGKGSQIVTAFASCTVPEG